MSVAHALGQGPIRFARSRLRAALHPVVKHLRRHPRRLGGDVREGATLNAIGDVGDQGFGRTKTMAHGVKLLK